MRQLLVIAAFFVTAGVTVPAQEGPMRLARLPGPITIDGMPDELAWQEVPALPLTMYSPVFRGTPRSRERAASSPL